MEGEGVNTLDFSISLHVCLLWMMLMMLMMLMLYDLNMQSLSFRYKERKGKRCGATGLNMASFPRDARPSPQSKYLSLIQILKGELPTLLPLHKYQKVV